MKEAWRFFYKHSGYSYPEGSGPIAIERERVCGALQLARAEAWAEEQGHTWDWQHDSEPYMMGDAETEMPKEVLCCLLRSAEGEVLGSLSGIGDPSRAYRRVVEAELACEAMP